MRGIETPGRSGEPQPAAGAGVVGAVNSSAPALLSHQAPRAEGVERGATVVLWVSRHKPLPAQLRALEEKLGEIDVVQIEHVPHADYVIDLARRLGAKVIVPVLPLSFIARLVEEAGKRGYVVLFAKMNAILTTRDFEEAKKLVLEAPEKRTITTYADGTLRVFEFERFERVVKVEVVTGPW
ncbi:MAG: hypothetical protein QW407_02280 [Thermofilaceae archaeon]